MDYTKRIDVGFTYWIVDGIEDIDDVIMYIMKHGYTPGDGRTFIIASIPLIEVVGSREYMIPMNDTPSNIARDHSVLLEATTYTIIDYYIDMIDMTRYMISPLGDVVLDDIILPLTYTEAAYSRGVQYNRGDCILTFRSLTSYILSKYDWSVVGTVMCSGTDKYAVHNVKEGPLCILEGILFYER